MKHWHGNRNTKRSFLRSRERILVKHDRTYNVGKNAAKRAKRGLA